MDLELRGRKAIITGATKGIGLRIARQFADEGADVGICARTAADVEATVAELKKKGVNAFGQAVDVTDREKYAAWIHACARELGGIDIFVSNTTGTPAIPGEAGWEAGFKIDVMGAVRGVETALPYLRKSNAAAIIFIASISGVMSKVLRVPGIYAYGSAKAALIAYGAQLSKDLAREGIRVNMVSPGPIYFEGGAWDFIKQHAPQVYEDALKECVIGRLGKPEEIAATVAFLASPKSGFTVGQNVHVDGGYMMHIAF